MHGAAVARSNNVMSPSGSAAAVSNICCAGAGSDRTRRAKLCSIWLTNG